MSKKQKRINLLGDILGCLVALVIFVIPFYSITLSSVLMQQQANGGAKQHAQHQIGTRIPIRAFGNQLAAGDMQHGAACKTQAERQRAGAHAAHQDADGCAQHRGHAADDGGQHGLFAA